MANQYDDAVKALCAVDVSALCNWLGVAVSGPASPMRLAESAPPSSTRAVDLLVAVDSSTVLHVEFQTRPESRFAQRMLDYWLRLDGQAELAGREIDQHVVQLGDGHLDAGLHRRRLRYSFVVHRLPDEDPDRFLADPMLAPYAVLAHVPNKLRRSVLTQALAIIAEVSDLHQREVLARAAVDLAAIRLDPATIESAWEESPMPVPSLLNQIHQQALELGREEGLEDAVASLLRVRFGPDDRIAAVAEALARRGATQAMAAIEAAPSLDDLSGQPGR